jgi:hypothetical protein
MALQVFILGRSRDQFQPMALQVFIFWKSRDQIQPMALEDDELSWFYPWRRGALDITSSSGTRRPGFKSRQGIRFLGKT